MQKVTSTIFLIFFSVGSVSAASTYKFPTVPTNFTNTSSNAIPIGIHFNDTQRSTVKPMIVWSSLTPWTFIFGVGISGFIFYNFVFLPWITTLQEKRRQALQEEELKKKKQQEQLEKKMQEEKGRWKAHELCWYAHQGKVTKVKKLIEKDGVSVNAQDPLEESGCTVLTLAVQSENSKLVAYLLTNKAIDVNKPDSTGGTPLHYAAALGLVEIIDQLLGHPDIDVNLAEKQGGWTPLHTAVFQGQDSAVAALLKSKKIQLNLQDKDGNTPLHFALLASKQKNPGPNRKEYELKNTKIINQLLSAPGIDVTIANKYDKTPLNIASWCELNNVAEKLKNLDCSQVFKKIVTLAINKGMLTELKDAFP